MKNLKVRFNDIVSINTATSQFNNANFTNPASHGVFYNL